MRFLIVDHQYQHFLENWYERHPGLDQFNYDDQRSSLRSSLVGETAFQAEALRSLGHEATDVIINVWPAQAAWAREHGDAPLNAARWGIRLRRGIIPWPIRRRDSRWVGEILLRQIDALEPDVVHISSMDFIDPALIPEIRSRCRFVVGQIAARLTTERALAGYDLIVSAVPTFVQRFRDQGLAAEWIPLAFEPRVLDMVGRHERNIPVSFVGSIFDVHRSRVRIIEAVAARAAVDVWTADRAPLSVLAESRIHTHPAVWGMDMYRVLASSCLTVNVHGYVEDAPPLHAANLRLYEATGMGALLITDRMRDLSRLFEVGREVVDFGDASQSGEVVRYYLDHPAEAAAIARAGQARTLRDHTWLDRMARLVDLVKDRI